MGRPYGNYSARSYYKMHDEHVQLVRDAYDSLASEFDIIVLEGAGSPAEINLQKTDLVNMQMAHYADASVIIVGDIDRGGVFAWLKGTYDLVPDKYKGLVAGFLINKFRGDVSLLEPGLEQFRTIIDLPFFGVLPWFDDITVDQEDGMFAHAVASGKNGAAIHIAGIHLPRISNFTDFAPLAFEEDVRVYLARDPREIEECDCLIIPGSKNTRSDLEFLKASGWREKIFELRKKGVLVLGICGGYQMLGTSIEDALGMEGEPGISSGLGLLPVATEMSRDKHLSQTTVTVDAPLVFPGPVRVNGYEIHMGRTRAQAEFVPLGPGLDESIGAISEDGQVAGTYLHGIFDNDELRRKFLDFLRVKKGLGPKETISSYRSFREEQLDRLAQWFSTNTDISGLLSLVGIK